MSCLMLHESIGDAFIDAAIPSLFSSIMILCAGLYNISPFALLFPLSVIVSFVGYYTFIYSPAKRAYEKRRSVLRGRQATADFDTHGKRFRSLPHEDTPRDQKRLTHGIREFIRRFLIKLKYGSISVITHVSVEGLKKRMAVKVAYLKKWGAMNKPTLHQGTMLSNSTSEFESAFTVKIELKEDDKDITTDTCSHKRKQRRASTPQLIIGMMTSSKVYRTATDGHIYAGTSSSVQVQAQDQQTTVPVSVLPAHDRIVTTSLDNNAIHRELQQVIIFHARDALLRIWSNLLNAAKNQKGDDININIEFNLDVVEIPSPTLLKELKNIFNVFYPDGIPLSEAAKIEACELFTIWTEEHQFTTFYGDVCVDTEVVPFRLFQIWFYDLSEMIHNRMSDRLFDYFMSSSNRSVATTAASRKYFKAVREQQAEDSNRQISASNVTSHQSVVLENYDNFTPDVNPIFGTSQYSADLHYRNDQAMIREALLPVDGDDLYSTYARSMSEGRLPDFINPMNTPMNMPRNMPRNTITNTTNNSTINTRVFGHQIYVRRTHLEEKEKNGNRMYLWTT